MIGRGATGIVVALGLLWLAPAGVRADDDALAIVERAFETARADQIAARQYVYKERIEERKLDKRGREKRRGSRTWDVTQLDGSEYRRLVAIDDRPLYPKTERKEREKLERQLEKLRNETPKQRAKRMARIERGQAEGERLLEAITRAFDFTLVGEDEVDGHATWVVAAEPKPGFRPPFREAKVLKAIRAKLWITKDGHHWLQAEMETTDNVRWALVLNLKKGTTIRFRQRPLDDGVWVTDHWRVRMALRAVGMFRYRAELIGSYRDFRRFTTDSSETYGEAVDGSSE